MLALRRTSVAQPYDRHRAVLVTLISYFVEPRSVLWRVMKYDPRTMNRRSIRLPHWDYRANGAYFITICTFARRCLFDDEPLGAIVEGVWRWVIGPGIGPGEFVVMPNHIHGIIWIAHEDSVEPWRAVPRRMRDGLEPGSLPVIVRSFKSATAKRVNRRRGTPGGPVWQHDYYEHVIRDDEDLYRIRQYILDNPGKWSEDPDNPAVLAHRAASLVKIRDEEPYGVRRG